MSAIGPIPSASLTRRRSRKKSVKSRGDKLDGTSGSPESDGTPMLFGQIPVEPPALNFSRDRKHSTGAVNMDPKFSSPALQAAMKSSTSLVENSRSPEVTRTTRPFSSNWKRHAVHEEPDANHSPSTIAHAVESGTLNSVRNNHKTSSYLPVYLPGKKKSTPGIRKGPTQNNPSVPPTSAPSSSATPPELTPSSSLLSGNSRHSFGLGVGTRNAPSFPSPQPTSPATENVSQTLKHRFSFSRKTKRSMDLGSAAPPCTATQPSPSSLRERADNLAALSRTSRPPTGGESAKNTQSLPTTHSSSVRSPGFTANQDATQFSPFYAPTGTAKRAKKTSFSNLFTKNRNRSTAMEDNPDRQVTPMQKAMDSSVSLAESVTKRRSLVNFFRNRTKSTEGHTDALDKPGLGLHPDGGKNIDLSARSLKSPQEPVKRRKSFQRLGAKPKPLTATESSGPSVAALFKPLSARAPEFIPRGLCTKLVPDTGPLVFASTSKEKAYPLGPTVVGSTDSVGKAAETNVVSTSTTDRLQTASQSNHQSSCTSPHRRKASSEAVRKPLRTESTVPFPVSHDEPVEIAVAVDAEVLVIASEDELKLTEDNRYWIYKVSYYEPIILPTPAHSSHRVCLVSCGPKQSHEMIQGTYYLDLNDESNSASVSNRK
ncbi:hypothetical protein C8R47DRAFT_1117875 [Mycena vitilis]|nr:hypothetical protein C8R47DRAFT_1117875 [Mycena vitilis]